MRSALFFKLFAVVIFGTISSGVLVAQQGTDVQRMDVMRDKLDRARRSLNSSITVIREENRSDRSKRDDDKKLDTPLGRLVALERDTRKLAGDVNSLRGKIDRSEKFERDDIDSMEQAVTELLQRIETVQLETAAERAQVTSPVGRPREVKKKKKFLGIFGGGGTDEYEELIGSVSPGRDKELFIVATREVRRKNFDVGRLLFQTIVTTYPDSPYLPMAKLAVGDSFFLEGSTSSLIQAIASYQDWLTFFPTHPLADRVVLKIAESEMRQIGLPDRDATRARRAEARLKALLQQYPNSVLVSDAELRLREVQDNLGLHNLLIANYYYNLSIDQRKGGLKGAQSRYREILDKYPGFSFMDEVLFKLAVTYVTEEETDQAARYFQQIVRDHPNSDYVQRSIEQLNLIGAAVPPADPERAKIMKPEDKSFFQNFKNQFFGIYPMTIDRDGVLMTKDFDREKFELIDQIIIGEGEITINQIPRALTTVISTQRVTPAQPRSVETPQK